MKVFDCINMPSDVRKALFDTEMARCNDVCIEYDIYESMEQDKLLCDWLIENGAKEEETVIIKWRW